MARPQKNNLEYFPHENCMRNDKKLLAIRNKFENMVGYGLYNAMLEAISEEDLLQITYSDDQIELLAGDFRVSSDTLKAFIEYSKQIDLLQVEDGFIRCKQLEKRGEEVFLKRGRTLDCLRVSATETTGDVGFPLQKLQQVEVLAPESTQSKVKESKGNKNKEKESHFIEFKKNYPPNGSAVNPTVEREYIKAITTGGDDPVFINQRAKEYADYWRSILGDTYPYGEKAMIKNADNWLREKLYMTDWAQKTKFSIGQNNQKKELTDEEKYHRFGIPFPTHEELMAIAIREAKEHDEREAREAREAAAKK
jgi:hypothetical protein